jgi:hypothetical protein
MSDNSCLDFSALYAGFHSPIAGASDSTTVTLPILDCGDRCAPYNERGVPFCCDLRHTIPTVYQAEWEYLQAHTALWHRWDSGDAAQNRAMQEQAPAGQLLVACLGHTRCQRNFRSITCRAFPFFPYITRQSELIGLAPYWEYADRCWVISNLQVVSPVYREEFIRTYERIFARMPEELENFRYFSTLMRRVFGRRRQAIPLLHRNGSFYKVTPRNGRLRRVPPEKLPKYGPYLLAAQMPFPDEQPSPH